MMQSSELKEFSFEDTTFYYGEHSYDITSRMEEVNAIYPLFLLGKEL